MDRRDFTRTMLGASLTGSALMLPVPGFGNQDRDRDRLSTGAIGRIHLRIAVGQLLVAWILIALRERFLGLDLRQDMPQYREDGLGESDSIPLLGGLLRQPLNVSFRGAQTVANVVLVRNMLVLLPFAANMAPPRQVAIAHRSLSWEPGGQFSAVRMKNLPDVPLLTDLPVIGQAFRKPGAPAKRNLLVVINPSIVNPAES
jgi:hypothetical protein